jgi:hypothetical protein
VPGRDYNTTWATASDFGDSLGLVVWAGGGVEGIEGCRVRRDMSVVDSICLDISGPGYLASPGELHTVDVAWSGENWLVVWLDGADVCGSIVSPQGDIIRRVSICQGARGWVSVASDGSSYLVTWEQDSGEKTWEMYRLVSGDGTPLDTARRVSQSGGTQCNGDVEFTDSCYMVAFWRNDAQGNNAGLSAVRIRPDGSLLDSVPIPVFDGFVTAAPTLGCFADNFYAAWCEGMSPANIKMARVTPGGAVLDSGGVSVGHDSMVWGLSSVALGDTCLLAWASYGAESASVRTLRVDQQAHQLDSINLSVTTVTYAPIPPGAVSVMPASDFAVTWCQLQYPVTNTWNSRGVVCRRVSSSGVLVDSTDLRLSCAANTQLGNDVASDGQDFLAVWQDWTGLPLTSRLRMKRFSPDGTLLDSVGIPVGDSDAHLGAVAYGPGFYFVCWIQAAGSKIEAARVGRDGVVLDSLPILISQCPSKPGQVDVAYGDSMFLVVWYRGGSGVFGVRVRADGVVLDSVPRRVTHNTYFCFVPHVASDGLNFLVTYNGDSQGLHAVRVDSAGQLMDPTDTYLGDIPGDDWSAPAVFGAGFYMVYDWGGSRAWRISAHTGEVLNSLRGLGLGEESSITFDGVDFLISGRAGPYVKYAIGGQRISPTGVLRDSSPLVLATVDSATSVVCYYGGCAADANGNLGLMLTSYERPRYMSYRVRAAACPALAIGDERGARPARVKQSPTITRGVLFLPRSTSPSASTSLLDVSGREVMTLKLGENDVRALAPGVYFLRRPKTEDGRPDAAVTKVVITR